ncbi:hypothetical protein V2A60_005055 [Cordyceps javanica]
MCVYQLDRACQTTSRRGWSPYAHGAPGHTGGGADHAPRSYALLFCLAFQIMGLGLEAAAGRARTLPSSDAALLGTTEVAQVAGDNTP